MNRIQKMYQRQSANFRLSQLSLQSYRQSTNLSHKSPSQQSTLDANLNSRSCPIKTNILTKMLTKMYDQFHYIDQVTFKKTNMKNLCPKKKIREKGNNIKGITSDVRGKNYSKSCENIELGTEKQEYQSNTILKLNSVDDRETMKSFNNLQNYIQEIKRIKQFRLNQLTTKRQKYLQKKKIKRHSEEEELGDQKVKEGSLIEKEKKQRKIIKEIKNKLYQINIEQFRKYCKKQQKFDPKKQKVLQFSSNVEKYLERPTQSKWSEYQKPLEHKLRRQKIKNSYIYDKQFDTILSNQASEFGKLIRMRIRHETQFNWQRNKMI